MYKLIAIDIDGTLLNDRHEVTDEVREAIIEAKKQGIKIVLCSGRAVGGVVRFLEELELKGEDNYIVALNGALIQNASTSEVIHKQNLSLEDLQNLYKLSQEFKTCIVFFDEADIFILNKDIPKYIVQEAFLSQVNLYYRDIEEITDDYIVSNVLFVDEPERLEQIIASIPAEFKEKYAMVKSAPYYFEFLHPESSKGNALRIIAEKLGIRREEIMSIGDSGNDLSMIQYAGCGVAMGNAMEELKQHADFITLSNNESGVAHAIRKFVLL